MNATDNTTLGRATASVLTHSRGSLGQFEPFLTAIYDAVGLIDTTVTQDNVSEYAPVLVATARTIADLADTLKSSSYDALRCTLTNLSINLVMVVVESLDRAGKGDEAQAIVAGDAYEYAKRQASWNEKFPASERILRQLDWQTFAAPKLLCDRASARERISTHHEGRQKLLNKIERNLDSARFSLREAGSLISQCLHLFEFELDDCILRLRPETPYALKTAKSWILCGEKHINAIDATDASEANVNRSDRTRVVAALVEAQVKVHVARAYIEYWKDGKGFRNFEVLAHQVLGYGEALTEDNWDFFAPKVLCHAHEPLDKEVADDAWRMCRYADTAIAYAMCLDAQMRVLPLRMQPPRLEGVKVAKPETPETINAAEFPTVGDFAESLATQALANEFHHSRTGDDKREDAWLRRGRSTPRIYPKQRLIGFDRLRAGKTHKAKKSA